MIELRNTVLRLIPACLLVTGLLAYAQETYKLRYVPVKGYEEKYTATLKGNGDFELSGEKQKLAIRGSLTLREKCLGIEKGEARLVEVKLLGGTVAISDSDEPMKLSESRLVIVRDTLGKVTEIRDSQGFQGSAGGVPVDLGALTSALSQIASFPEPAQPIGGTWTSKQRVPLDEKSSVFITAESVLKTVAREGRRQVAVVDSQITVPVELPAPSMKLTVSGKIVANLRSYIFLDNGTLMKSTCRAAVNVLAYSTEGKDRRLIGRLQIPDLLAEIGPAEG